MAVTESETYTNFPPFLQALKDLQAGKWEEGLAGLAEVEKRYPLDTNLRALRQEMQVRARVDEYEIEENKARKNRQWRRYGVRALLLLLVVVLLFTAVATYSGWLGKQLTSAQQAINSQVRQTELVVLLMNAKQLLQAGQTADAIKILDEISQSEPDYPGLSDTMAAAVAQQELETQYSRAMEMLAAGNSQDALAILQMIQEQAPQYRDVALQIASLETQTQMDAYTTQADLAFNEARWADAIAGYESLRLLEPTYQTTYIEEKLFQAYINAASVALEEEHPSLETLQTADGYFSQALSLRPQDREAVAARTAVRATIENRMVSDYIQAAQAALVDNADSLEALAIAENYFSMALDLSPNDPTVLAQFQMAQYYLEAVANFSAGLYADAIERLEYVVGLEPGYATGTARQTLFEAYIARGQAELTTGDYEFAILDFQKAAALAQQTEEALSTYFEAQILIAEAEGLAGNYLQAILLYQNALFESGMRDQFLASTTELSNQLINAEAYAAATNYQGSYLLYRDLLQSRFTAYDTTMVVRIKKGDYITSLARQYNTTVAAILSANGLTNQDRLDPNTELIIPVLP